MSTPHSDLNSVPFYILWNPDSPKPPTVRFWSEGEAERVAQSMAIQHKGKFYVMRVRSAAEVVEPVKFTKWNDRG